MASNSFPDPNEHEFAEWVVFGDFYYHATDIIGFGGDLTVEKLQEAYRKGIFPWHIDGMPLPWFCPAKRAILEFGDLHIPKSLAKAQRTSAYNMTIDRDFETVIRKCASTKRNSESGTWITAEFIDTYFALHKKGSAHSVEVWDDDGEVVGGLYGVDAGGVFCGESMFFEKPNASKLALLFLIEHLKSRGSDWIDIQVMTPHMRVMGAKEIDRAEFLSRLETEQKNNGKLF